jgi:hypothetical protein
MSDMRGGRLSVAGGWGGDVDAQGMSASLGDEGVDVVEASPVLADDEQGVAMRATEGIREAWSIELDALQDLAAFVHAHRGTACVGLVAIRCAYVGGATPDGALGVDADTVQTDGLPTLRGQAAAIP